MDASACNSTLSLTDHQLRPVFSSFDKDGDGKLSAHELSLCMSMIGEQLSVDEAQEFMKLVDSDCDELLDFEEFMKLVKGDQEDENKSSKELRAAFAMYATGGEEEEHSLCITPKSLKRMLSMLGTSRNIEDCHAMICSYDINGDGVINFEEFKLMMTRA